MNILTLLLYQDPSNYGVKLEYITVTIYLRRIYLRSIIRHLGYERVYLPLYEVADTPFHIQGDELCLLFK